jgi:aerobic carbon-monoxide dehydrogenase large subunit
VTDTVTTPGAPQVGAPGALLPGDSGRHQASAGIGSPVRRVETLRFVRGAGSYVDDRRPPGMLHVAFVRSTFPHATIRSADTSRALDHPGVHAVVTGRDARDLLHPVGGRLPLAEEVARFVGEPVAAVVAESRYVAEDAMELVDVTYEALEPVVRPEAALEPSSPLLFPTAGSNCTYDREFSSPGVESAFASADLVFEAEYRSARAAPAPMEPRSYAAQWDAQSGVMTVWSCTASPYALRADIATTLGIPESHVRVEVADVGGSFGGKNAIYPEELTVAWLAWLTGRPVSWTETRSEHLVATYHGRDQLHRVRAAFSRDGLILALEDDFLADMGASRSVDNSVNSAADYLPGAYVVPEIKVRARAVVSNKAPHGSLRGIGKADAAFVIERVMDRAARLLDIDRAEIRLRNLVPADAFPFRTATGALLDSGRYETCLRKALALAGYDSLMREAADLRERGVCRGVGVSFVIEPTSASRPGVGMGFASCRLVVTPHGDVLAYSGTSQQGQGHQTTIAQIIASHLDIPLDSIRVTLSDTDVTPHGFTAGSSRSTTVLMSAVYRAAEAAAGKLRAIAAHQWSTDPADVRLVDGGAEYEGRRLSFQEIAESAYIRMDRLPPGMEPGLEVIGTFVNPNIDYERNERGLANAFSTYPYEACVVVVDVDQATGLPSIRSWVSVHDCGVEINPRIVETQHIGATVQGIGLALMEELPFSDDGNPLATTFLEYLLPTVNDLPERLLLDSIVTPTPFTPLGAKGIGETGTLTAPVVLASAIEDALGVPYVTLNELPITGERVVRALHQARNAAHEAGKSTAGAGQAARSAGGGQ